MWLRFWIDKKSNYAFLCGRTYFNFYTYIVTKIGLHDNGSVAFRKPDINLVLVQLGLSP